MSDDDGLEHDPPADGADFDLHDWRNAVASRQGPVNDTTRLVLLVLSLHMNPQGVAWPSQDKLVERTALSRRTVQTALRRAERGGWIVRSLQDQPGQRWRLTRYRAVLPDRVDPPAKPWDREPWRQSEDKAGATTAPRPTSPKREAGESIAPPSAPSAPTEPRRWRNYCTKVAHPLPKGGANGDQKVAQPLRTNSPENYPENSPREGALTHTGDGRATDDLTPELSPAGLTPAVQQSAPSRKPQRDNAAAIRQLLDFGHRPGDIVHVLSSRGVTLEHVAAVNAARHQSPSLTDAGSSTAGHR